MFRLAGVVLVACLAVCCQGYGLQDIDRRLGEILADRDEFHPDHAKTDTFLIESSATAEPEKKGDAKEPQQQKPLGKVDKSQDGCILCQYIVGDIAFHIKAAGLMPVHGSRPNRDSYAKSIREGNDPQIAKSEGYLNKRLGEKKKGGDKGDESSFLQTSQLYYGNTAPLSSYPSPVMPLYTSTSTQPPSAPYTAGYPHMDSNTELYYERLQFAEYNQLTQVADMALDEVCESSMPNPLYKHCQAVFHHQAEIVSRIGRQFNPQDICIAVNLCKKDSYLFKLKHTHQPIMHMVKPDSK